MNDPKGSRRFAATSEASVKEINRAVNKRLLKPLYGHYQADRVGILQIDLMDMSSYKTRNKNFGYALLIIDVYSRYAWAIPIKRKYASDVYEAFKSWYESANIDVLKVYSDIGNEFLGDFSKYLEEKGIVQVMIDSKEQHQAIVERWIRTLKEKIKDYWVENDNFDWVSVLPEIVEDYNNAVHSRMKAKPIDVLNGKDSPKFKYKNNDDKQLEVGDKVRIITQKNLFDKPSLTHNYSKNVYVIESFNGTSYQLNNGKSYPRWKLLKSGSEIPQKDVEPVVKQREIKAEKRLEEEFKRDEIKQENILPEKTVRERRPNTRFNDFYVGGGMRGVVLNEYVRF